MVRCSKQFFAGHKDAAENPTLAQGPYVERREQETGSHGYSCTHGRAGNKVKGKRGSRLTSSKLMTNGSNNFRQILLVRCGATRL